MTGHTNIFLQQQYLFFIVSSIGKYAGIKSYNETKALHWDRFRIWYYRFRQNQGKKNVIDIQVFDYLLINFEWIENILASMILTNNIYFRRGREVMNLFLWNQIQMKKYRRSRILQISWKNSREMGEQWYSILHNNIKKKSIFKIEFFPVRFQNQLLFLQKQR